MAINERKNSLKLLSISIQKIILKNISCNYDLNWTLRKCDNNCTDRNELALSSA